MPKRRRPATREELLELLRGREPGVDWDLALDALEALEEEGPVVQVRIVVDEEV